MLKLSLPYCTRRCLIGIGAVIALAACSPKYDWREVHGTDAPFVVLLPAKPVTLSRPVNLDGIAVTMVMTAAQVDGVSFAVGSATLPDAASAQLALLAMKKAMINNINGTLESEKSTGTAASPERAANGSIGIGSIATEIEAAGSSGGKPVRLFGRFVVQGSRVYQVIVLGPENAVPRDAVDTFLRSFKLN